MDREAAVVNLVTGYNHFSFARSYLFNHTITIDVTGYNIIYIHGRGADAQVTFASNSTLHTPAGSTADLSDLSFISLYEGLHWGSATEFGVH